MELLLVTFLIFLFFSIAISIPVSHLLWKRYKRPPTKIPGWNTRQRQVKDFFDPRDVSLALRVFQSSWAELIDSRDTKKIIDEINIFWKSNPIELGQTYTVGGKTFSKATGLTRTKKDIDVWIYDYYNETVDGKKVKKEKTADQIKISSTALVHELIHVLLWNLDGDPDADHEGTVYGKTWTSLHSQLEVEVNKRLTEKGL